MKNLYSKVLIIDKDHKKNKTIIDCNHTIISNKQ